MMFKLNGKQVCDSRAAYNAAGVDAHSQMEGMGHGTEGGGMGGGMLSDMSTCFTGLDVKKGDMIDMEAYYDTELHPV
jgi:hypothetical protein